MTRLSILDQLLAGAGPEGVTYTSAIALLGVTDGALLDDMVDALAAGDAAGVYGTVDRVVEAGHDPRRFSVDLLDRFRDLILLDAVPDAGERGLIDVPQDQLAHMADQALRLGGATLTRYAEIVHTALDRDARDDRGPSRPRAAVRSDDAAGRLDGRGRGPATRRAARAPADRRRRIRAGCRRGSRLGPTREDGSQGRRRRSRPRQPAGPAAERAHEAQPTATVRPEATERPPAVRRLRRSRSAN